MFFDTRIFAAKVAERFKAPEKITSEWRVVAEGNDGMGWTEVARHVAEQAKDGQYNLHKQVVTFDLYGGGASAYDPHSLGERLSRAFLGTVKTGEFSKEGAIAALSKFEETYPKVCVGYSLQGRIPHYSTLTAC